PPVQFWTISPVAVSVMLPERVTVPPSWLVISTERPAVLLIPPAKVTDAALAPSRKSVLAAPVIKPPLIVTERPRALKKLRLSTPLVELALSSFTITEPLTIFRARSPVALAVAFERMRKPTDAPEKARPLAEFTFIPITQLSLPRETPVPLA